MEFNSDFVGKLICIWYIVAMATLPMWVLRFDLYIIGVGFILIVLCFILMWKELR
jgi:hypothetical protein